MDVFDPSSCQCCTQAVLICGSNVIPFFIVVTLPSTGHIAQQQILKQEIERSNAQELRMAGKGNEICLDM